MAKDTLKYVWPFYNIMHERVKKNIAVFWYLEQIFSINFHLIYYVNPLVPGAH